LFYDLLNYKTSTIFKLVKYMSKFVCGMRRFDKHKIDPVRTHTDKDTDKKLQELMKMREEQDKMNFLQKSSQKESTSFLQKSSQKESTSFLQKSSQKESISFSENTSSIVPSTTEAHYTPWKIPSASK